MKLQIGALAFGFYIALGTYASVHAQIISENRCPYLSGLPARACTVTQKPQGIPAAYGGALMQRPTCSDVLPQASASLYSYDDVSCRQAGSSIGSD